MPENMVTIDGWRPLRTAPKTGDMVELTHFDEKGRQTETYVMSWDPSARNGFFPDAVGFWVSADGKFTWNHREIDGPTHWRPVER